MDDATPGAAGLPEPAIPEPVVPEVTPPAVPDLASPVGDETVRLPAQPEVAWEAPQPPQAMPWEAPVAAAGIGATASLPPALPGLPPTDPGTPLVPPAEPGAWATPSAEGQTGVLSASTVGWVTPPPKPVPTGNPGWVIASIGVRLVALFIDGILGGILILTVIGIIVAVYPDITRGGVAVTIAYSIAVTGFYFLYFVGFWTSKGKATIGMRILKLQVANAVDGKRLAIGPAIIRWLAIGYIFSLVSIIPIAAELSGFANFIWAIVLLVTAASHPLHQGMHDRWAGSVVVRPAEAGAGSSAWVAACLIMVGIIVLFLLFAVIGLIFLGSQMSNILSAVGQSI